MTQDTTKTAPGADPGAEGPPIRTAEDIIGGPKVEPPPAGKAPTLAADAAANLVGGGAEGTGGAGADPTPTAPAIGRGSVRAKEGFHRKLTKPQLIERGRKLAERAAAMEAELAQLKGEPSPDGGEGGAVQVSIDPAALEEPLAEMAGVVSDFLSAWRGDHWQFTPEERAKLGKAGAPNVAELAPALGAHASKVTLVLVVLGIAMPRLRKDRELAAANPTPAS